jgi:hypothetical protein
VRMRDWTRPLRVTYDHTGDAAYAFLACIS